MPKRGLGVLYYTIAGFGKTTWALRWPKPLVCFSLQETGFDDYKFLGEIPEGCTGLSPSSYESLWNLLVGIQKEPTFKTVVIDTLSGFQQMYFEHLIKQGMKNTRSGTQEESEANFWAFYRGPRMEAPNSLVPFLSLITALLNQGVHVVLLGHKRNDVEENVAGADYKKAVVDIDEGIRNVFIKWSPNIFFGTLNTSISQATKTSGYGENTMILEGKANAIADRLMYTSTNSQNDAKNKLHLPTIIQMGNSPDEAFNNFWKHVPQVYKD